MNIKVESCESSATVGVQRITNTSIHDEDSRRSQIVVGSVDFAEWISTVDYKHEILRFLHSRGFVKIAETRCHGVVTSRSRWEYLFRQSIG